MLDGLRKAPLFFKHDGHVVVHVRVRFEPQCLGVLGDSLADSSLVYQCIREIVVCLAMRKAAA